MPDYPDSLPTVPSALNDDTLLQLGFDIATAMPGLPPKLLMPAHYAASIVWDAARWRALGRRVQVLAEIEQRRLAVEASHTISAAVDWRTVANGPTHAELQRRRTTYTTPALTPEQIRARADASRRAAEQAIESEAA